MLSPRPVITRESRIAPEIVTKSVLSMLRIEGGRPDPRIQLEDKFLHSFTSADDRP